MTKRILIVLLALIGLTLTGCASGPYSLPKDSVITVDYARPITTMVASGSFDNYWGTCGTRDLDKWCASNHVDTAHFPIRNDGHQETVLVKLVTFPEKVSLGTAWATIYKSGDEPANLAQLLAFAAQYPEAQLSGDVVAIKHVAVSGDRQLVPVIYSQKYRSMASLTGHPYGIFETSRLERKFELRGTDKDFPVGTQFLVITR